MLATAADIRRWLQEAREKDATHVIVVRNLRENDEFPILVMWNESLVDGIDRLEQGKDLRVGDICVVGRLNLWPQFKRWLVHMVG